MNSEIILFGRCLHRNIGKLISNKKNILKRKYSHDSNLSNLSVVVSNGVKTITMVDQKTRNALSISMMKNLINNIVNDKDDPELRIIVIAAEGKVFSSGHNLKELSPSVDKTTHEEVFRLGSTLMDAIMDSPVPVIAKVNGVAAAAGCQLVAQCDLAICSEHSMFLTPGVKYGIFCSTPGVALSRSTHKSTTMKMLLTGNPITAKEAQFSGLVCETCLEEDLNKIVDSYCNDIKKNSRQVVELGRKFYYHQLKLDTKEAFRIGGDVMVGNLQLADGKEGINSFVEKRKALWTHGVESLNKIKS